MMNMKKYLIIIAMAVCSTAVFGQKLGHIDGQALLLAMPERADIEQQIEAQASQVEKALVEMQNEYEAKVKEFQENPNWPESLKTTKYNAIINLEKDMKDFAAQAEQELANKEAELLQPMVDRARASIDKVAKENGFTYILDASQGVILYEGGEDIMPLVKKDLGIE
jgi:outer membrane protein